MLGIKAALVALSSVLIENVGKTKAVEEAGRGKAEKNRPVGGCTYLAGDLNVFGQISTTTRAELQPSAAIILYPPCSCQDQDRTQSEKICLDSMRLHQYTMVLEVLYSTTDF